VKNKNGPHITIVDDDRDLLDLMNTYFRQKGFQTATFIQPDEAIIEIENKRLTTDIIICDLKLPNINGIEFVKRIKKFDENVPIILMTSESNVEIAVEAIQAGAYDFLLKPLHFPQLLISTQRAIFLNELREENNKLKSLICENEAGIKGVIGKSDGFKRTLDMAKRVSKSSANVLITGESGTGKEVIAKSIHELGDRKEGPFIAINCSAIPENLLESELFGHTKGAFTGATDKRIGLFEEANKGTLFLDEIGDLSLPLQAKLLRVLQEKKIKRIGENQYREITSRIICATHKNLQKEVQEGHFREDLFFRLNVIPITIPPLRERVEDIMPLSEYFLKKFSLINNIQIKGFTREAIYKIEKYEWKGNVRELENAIERAVVLSDSEYIQPEDLPPFESNAQIKSHPENLLIPNLDLTYANLSLDQVCRHYIKLVYKKNEGAKEQTARDLGIDRKTLYRKLKEIELH
jgi:DNA-binding NtrC family response regulator